MLLFYAEAAYVACCPPVVEIVCALAKKLSERSFCSVCFKSCVCEAVCEDTVDWAIVLFAEAYFDEGLIVP